MASTIISSNTNFSISRDSIDRPKMLKDFLRDDYNNNSCTSSSSSSSSTRFDQLYPRKKSATLISSKSNVQLRRRFFGIHNKVISLVKLFPLSYVKSPLVLPRSISRKMSRRRGKDDISRDVSEVKVKVKDILRWRSFRDLAEDNSEPLDFAAEDSPVRFGEINKDLCLGENDPKGEWLFEEECDDQQSPVSILDFPFLEDEESISPFHARFENIRRTQCMLTRRIQELEVRNIGEIVNSEENEEENEDEEVGNADAEEKVKQLLNQVEETIPYENREIHDDNLILDFFKHELSINGKFREVEFDNEVLGIVQSWMNGEYDESFEWEMEENREAYVKDMERGVGWKNFEQEREDICKELQIDVCDDLIDEILMDFLMY